MVFWSWRLTWWRWLAVRREFMPKVGLGLLTIGFAIVPIRFARGHLDSLPGFSHDSWTRIYELKNDLLDDDKVRILAQRRYESLKKRAEAREFFHEHGYQPRATNLHYKFSEINSI